MSKRAIFPVLACVALMLLLSSCRSNEFRLEFSLPAKVNDSYSALYYASDPEKGWLRDEVVVVGGGKGELVGATYNPTLLYLFKGSASPLLAVFVDRGDRIRISGDADPLSWRVEGNEINEQISDWRMEYRKSLDANDPADINAAVADYVEKYPDRPSSTLLLLLYYNREVDPDGFAKTWKMLRGEARDESWSLLTGRADLVGGLAEPASVLKNPVLRVAGKGIDTIRTDKAPAVFYFAETGTKSREDDLDVLKSFMRDRGDSASLTVVEVNLEPDSLSWVYRLPKDTLKGAVRAWMPLGFSDPKAVEYGLTSLPLFIVTAKGGRVLYRGASSDDAVRALPLRP